MPKPKIFISHSHDDHRLVSRIQTLLNWASADGFEIGRSSEDGSIKTGNNWYDWIDEQVLKCDVALVVLTPGSFRGAWVMWEAGAAAGIQRARADPANSPPDNQDDNGPESRRVRVMGFRLGATRLGPFERDQTVDGLNQGKMLAFIEELTEDYRSRLDAKKLNKNWKTMDLKIAEFVDGASEDLRYTPILATEDIVQEWLGRIDDALARQDASWIAAARRWINVAFLGAGNVDELKPIDFRIHSRLASGHERAKDWPRAVTELKLAAELSPNDIPILVRLGRALLSAGQRDQVSDHLKTLETLDKNVFISDREAITLHCRFLADSNDWPAVDQLLATAAASLVAQDEYLATWRALASMRVNGAAESQKWFRQLKEATATREGFWGLASHLNAVFAVGWKDTAEVEHLLGKLDLPSQPANHIESATRYYDEILKAYGKNLDWRSIAGIQTE